MTPPQQTTYGNIVEILRQKEKLLIIFLTVFNDYTILYDKNIYYLGYFRGSVLHMVLYVGKDSD